MTRDEQLATIRKRFPNRQSFDLADFAFQDIAGYRRLEAVKSLALNHFSDSGLLEKNRNKTVTSDDIQLLKSFLEIADPQKAGWRLTQTPAPNNEGTTCVRGSVDPSTFANWNAVGGPAEHFELAGKMALHIHDRFQTLYPNSPIARLDRNELHAAALMHDFGRLITHQFFLSGEVQTHLLKAIGIRKELCDALPKEELMLGEPDSMQKRIDALTPFQFVVRIADEFGKREPGTNRLIHPDECKRERWEKWAESYRKRDQGWVSVERHMRDHLGRHLDNEEPYYAALDARIRRESSGTLTLRSIVESFDTKELQPLNDPVLIVGPDVVDGRMYRRSITLGEYPIEVQATSFRGRRFNKERKPHNEDGLCIISHPNELVIVLVVGATQILPADFKGLSGGAFVARTVEVESASLKPNISAKDILTHLNRRLGVVRKAEFPSIEAGPGCPYGSIACLRILADGSLDVANAGDVSVLVVYNNGESLLTTKDDVRAWDEKTFDEVRRLAKQHDASFAYVMTNRSQDRRFESVNDFMRESTQAGMDGEIGRIHGLDLFRLTESQSLPPKSFDDIQAIYLFTDGGVLQGLDPSDKNTRVELLTFFGGPLSEIASKISKQ